MTTTKTTSQIATEARQIAGAIYDDATGTVVERIEACLAHRNLGTDGDLTAEDRAELQRLLDAAKAAE